MLEGKGYEVRHETQKQRDSNDVPKVDKTKQQQPEFLTLSVSLRLEAFQEIRSPRVCAQDKELQPHSFRFSRVFLEIFLNLM